MKLIEKDALVAEIDRQIELLKPFLGACAGQIVAEANDKLSVLEELKNFLNTLEVKEVDLDFQTFAKEMDSIFALPSSETKNTEENPLKWEYAIAKYFYELGLKVQKGE